jgi:hypothetical protein
LRSFPLDGNLEASSDESKGSINIQIAKEALKLQLAAQNMAEHVTATASLRLKKGGELFSALLESLQAVSVAAALLLADTDPVLRRVARNVRAEDIQSNLVAARECFDRCYSDCNSDASGGGGASGFEWVDGVVVQALKRGHWLLIDNVNLCSASVLDRLNSLLEPNGTLLLTESGAGTVLTPHPDFRVFFAMDASLGINTAIYVLHI